MSIEICVSAGVFVFVIFYFVGPTKSFVILECLAYMTTYNVHSYMIGQIWTVKILL